MEYVTLNNGVKMPKLGLGVFRVTDLAQAEEMVYQAVEQVGYRLIDTAAAYGNEKAVGAALARTSVAREDIFVTSKLWLSDIKTDGYEGAKRGLERSLKNLGLDYIDLYLIHQPLGDLYGAWRYLSEAVRAGKIRAIGVDNFTQAKLAEFAAFNEVVPAVNMIEANVLHQRTEDQKAMAARGVQMEAWAPFGAGNTEIFNSPVLKSMAESHGKTVGQVILRWFMQRDIVAIPKTVRIERMRENLAVFDFALTESEMAAIARLDQGGGYSLPDTADGMDQLLELLSGYDTLLDA
ncbi:aldo/keto reductase [Streptococcus panodentis]|uniref:2,5-diketo-D-gluconic acid reductase n=1 Tax=Streptococcus panodentis TaxID=1581472 RepID=A0ABS5B237_9STRE|nr:aldo/keto reductase [Streptococcus panodentis]MBP2622009.1 2,5-diketo-D-gluconic acid reductase [Streptococcus panodentis]